MRSLIEMLSDLRSRGVVLSMEGDRLQCNAPKGVITSEIRSELAARKEEILNLLKTSLENNSHESNVDAAEFSLSSSQRRLWFIQKMDPQNPVYHMAVAIQMTGELQWGALENSLRILVNRHESLRTAFHESDGKPFARIIESNTWNPAFVDLAYLEPKAAQDEATRRAVEEARTPFVLEQAPLFRATLYRTDSDHHLLMLVMHHIISDGWSLGILARELGMIYSDLRSGKEPSLPPLISRFRDFVRLESDAVQRNSEAHLGYWLERLRGPLPLSQLSGRRRPAVPSFRGQHSSVTIDAYLRDSVEELCRDNDVTPFMFLLAVFEVLLYRYTRQTDLLVGTANSNRSRGEFSSVVGFFVDNLVLRCDMSGNPRFQDLLRQVRRVAHESYAHEELPFSVLMERLQPARELSRNPLFQIAFIMQNVPLEPIQLEGLRIDAKPLDIGISPMDLSIAVWPEGGAYRLDLEYCTDLFDKEFIHDLQSQYLNLLRQLLDDPRQQIDDVQLVTEVESRRLLVDLNVTAHPYPSSPVHSVFEEFVRTQGNATALTFADGEFSYEELNQKANAIGAWLSEYGLNAGSFVAVCAPGSPLGIAAFLGILKAGCAYFPVAPSDPPERLRKMMQDAGTTVLLTTAAFRERLILPEAVSTALLEEISAKPCAEFAGPAIHSDDPACLLFTSGSTGRPKGVVVPHRSIMRLVRGTDYARFASDEVFLQACTLSFDASTAEIWGALLNGARLVLIDSERPSVEEISRAIRDHGVTTLFITTAFFHHFAAYHPDAIASLNQVIVGGDVLSPTHAAQLLYKSPDIHLVNGYGPTENGTFTTTCKVKLDSLDGSAIPIGRPICNTRVFLLDANRKPVPVGATGELYTAGDGLALGYLNAPKEIESPFVTLNFDEVGTVRAYRTGDLARYRSDGMLEFLGRTDKQVKVQGYRVEPAEVEEALLSIDRVRAVVVSTRIAADDSKQLVAYVISQSESVLSSGDLQLQLRRVLPRHQIPSTFLFIEEIPHTPNGKIDYAALDALPLESKMEGREVRLPSGEIEKKLLGDFKDLLHANAATVEDDLFSLGGHSLLAMQLLSRITAAFGVTLSVADIFQNPTVEGLAARVQAAGGVPAKAPSKNTRVKDPVNSKEHGLSRAQRRLWFLDQMDPGNPVYNIAIALRLDGPLDRVAFEETLQTIVSRHESLRARFLQRDGLPYVDVDDTQRLSIDFVDLASLASEAQEDQLKQLFSVESQRPYVLDQGQLCRVSLYRKNHREHVVLLGMHHIISDGWSIGVLAQELGRIYEATVRRLPCPLPPLPIQFRDFVQWESEQEKLSSGNDLTYWRNQLGGELPFLELPADRLRAPVQAFQGQRIFVDIDAGLEEKLQKIAREHNATFFMVLLAGFSVMLHRYSRQTDILIGTPTAGRTKSSFEGLIGFFVNNLVLRIGLADNPSFSELLSHVRSVALEAFEHQSTPFDQLVEILQPERNLDRSPIFQVLFTLQNTMMPRLQFDEMVMAPLEIERLHARYDLAVDIYPHEGHFRCSFEFNTDIFEETSIRQMLRHYIRILEMVCDNAQQQIGNLHLLDDAERCQLIHDWNRTAMPAPAYSNVPSWFRAQARTSPEAIAVEMGDRSLTYQDLDIESDRVAADLRSGGIGRGTIVGIYMQRSSNMVVGLLGILKAGAAYLPLDPALPSHRIEFMLSDAQVPLILTERELRDTLPATAAVIWPIEDVSKEGDAQVPDDVCSSDLAYLIYTSGSTGNPKGTEIQHEAFVNLLRSMLKDPGLRKEDTLVAITTISFDIAGLEIFGPLMCGAKLVLATREQTVDPELLAELLNSTGATVVQATPSTWRMLVESGWTGRPMLRMWCGGEALSLNLAESLLARGSELWNLYGPTETTIWSSVHRIRSGETQILIGRPITNTQMYILDDNLEPAPPGVAGELHISGDGVARGYWRRPELTASRFLPDPFDTIDARRMYRTGDLARYRRDGQIQLLGRTDHQIKLRGHRIEPGEIEIAMERHPAVRQAVVVLDGEGIEQRLVAYVRFEGSDDADQLRSWLHPILPDYMVPSMIVPLQEVPLTPNGKIDRKRLPALRGTLPDRSVDSISARNRTEQRLSELWSDLLHVERPGIRENFFDLGGHSLLLVQLHAQLKREFSANIAVVDLFRYPTIEALASFLDRRSAEVSLPVGANA
ncbi:non-ribosomal peptide synthetase [Terracidiphilus gabretensis]|uniref:non-ribosomal peptide synthetase n=1 Tax=Terracidiphilus gabretensis TaxID=1577687 RepID=UPI00071BE195|nr:non-ribosomal peptide synthetase [Terracidiphilus gabretensis]